MFQAQNRETINSNLKVAVSLKIIMSTSVTIVFHNTPPGLQDQDKDHSVQDQDHVFLVSDQSYPKTDDLRPHHWYQPLKGSLNT